jgi:hypothetical protein
MVAWPSDAKPWVPSGEPTGMFAEAGLTKVTESAMDKTVAATLPFLPNLSSIRSPSVNRWLNPPEYLAVLMDNVDT